MRESMRLDLLEWSEFIKINYFCKLLGLSASNVSNFIRFADRSLSDDKVVLLHETIRSVVGEKIA